MQVLQKGIISGASRRRILQGMAGTALVASSSFAAGVFPQAAAAGQEKRIGPDTVNRQWLLASRPRGNLTVGNFEYREVALGDTSLNDGDIIVRNVVFQPMPSQRIRMDSESGLGDAYLPPMPLGEPVTGSGVARVVKSANPDFPVGALITAGGAWEDYSRISGNRLRGTPLPAGIDPIDALSVYGMNAQAAYFGLLRIGEPKEGETIVVSGASGSVGSTVVQIARIKGCKVIGIAGGPEKCAALVEEYGVQGTIDYKNENISDKLRQLAPEGVDIYFDNVGGPIMQDVVDQMAKFGRVVLCGTISSYDSDNPPPGPRNMLRLVVYSIKMQGFLLPDYMDERDVALADLRKWNEAGLLKHKTDVRVGFKNLPETFLALFSGEKQGTLLLKVEDAEITG